MKLRKVLGGLLFGLGCAVALVGLMAALLPMIDNDQLQLVLSSFSMPSRNLLVNAFNAAMTYALGNCYVVMLVGAAFLIIGLLLMLSVREPEADAQPASARRASARPPVAAAPVCEAYTVADGDADEPDIPIWRAESVEESNPFADALLAAMLAPRVAPKPSEPANPFAPQPILGGDESADAYRRPEGAQADKQPQAVAAYAPPNGDTVRQKSNVSAGSASANAPQAFERSAATTVPAQAAPVQISASKPMQPAPSTPLNAKAVSQPKPLAAKQPVSQPAPDSAAKPSEIADPAIPFRATFLHEPRPVTEARIRSTFRAVPKPSAIASDDAAIDASAEIDEAAPPMSSSSPDAPAQAQPAASPRIRSTMGVHH